MEIESWSSRLNEEGTPEKTEEIQAVNGFHGGKERRF